MKKVIEKAEEFAIKEIKKFGTPPIALFDASFEQGQILVKEYNADADIVALGTILMDVKLGEAKNIGKSEDHVNMSVEASRDILKNLDVKKDVVEKVLDCVREHHGVKKFSSIEAEICANADCYRFLQPDLLLTFITGLINSGINLNEAVKFALKKMDEKYKIITLPIAIKDLSTHYATMKEFLENGVLKNVSSDYYKWTAYKQFINKKKKGVVYFRERQLWWTHIGENIGYEQNGHGSKALRPVLILKRINQHLFVGIPQTSQDKREYEYYYRYEHGGRAFTLLLLQVRVFSTKRLHEKMGTLNKVDFEKVKEKIKEWI